MSLQRLTEKIENAWCLSCPHCLSLLSKWLFLIHGSQGHVASMGSDSSRTSQSLPETFAAFPLTVILVLPSKLFLWSCPIQYLTSSLMVTARLMKSRLMIVNLSGSSSIWLQTSLRMQPLGSPWSIRFFEAMVSTFRSGRYLDMTRQFEVHISLQRKVKFSSDIGDMTSFEGYFQPALHCLESTRDKAPSMTGSSPPCFLLAILGQWRACLIAPTFWLLFHLECQVLCAGVA